jgi:hypothetical protein
MNLLLQTMIMVNPFIGFLRIVTQKVKHIIKKSLNWCKTLFFE